MTSVVYAGLEDTGRVLRWSEDVTQVTDADTEDVLFDIETQDLWPAGTAGDAVLRELAITVKTANGTTYTVTPSVDGVAQTAQDALILGAAIETTQIWPTNTDTVRGARFSVRITQTPPNTGAVELLDVSITAVLLRESP